MGKGVVLPDGGCILEYSEERFCVSGNIAFTVEPCSAPFAMVIELILEIFGLADWTNEKRRIEDICWIVVFVCRCWRVEGWLFLVILSFVIQIE